MKNQVLGIATQVRVMAIVISIVLLFVGIGVLVIIHFCIVGRAFSRGFGNNNNSSNNMIGERGSFGSRSMSKEDVEKLPCFDFIAEETKGSSSTSISPSPVDCAVCLENFKAGEKCRLLPICRHSFHAECVDMWLLRTSLCPICRASADSWRVVEECGPHVDIGNQLIRNYRQMRNEGGHLREAASEMVGSQTIETDAGEQPGDDQTVTERTQSRESTGAPASGRHVGETGLTELRGSQLAAETEARLRQTVELH